MSAPVAAGQLTDLETKYQAANTDYDAKVTRALASADATAAAAAVKAKQEMVRLAEEMVSVTTQTAITNLDTKHRQFLDRLHTCRPSITHCLQATTSSRPCRQSVPAKRKSSKVLFTFSAASLLSPVLLCWSLF